MAMLNPYHPGEILRDSLAAGVGPVVRRMERRLITYLVAAVLTILALIRYLWPDVSDYP